jgi:hypothetical protein
MANKRRDAPGLFRTEELRSDQNDNPDPGIESDADEQRRHSPSSRFLCAQAYQFAGGGPEPFCLCRRKVERPGANLFDNGRAAFIV